MQLGNRRRSLEAAVQAVAKLLNDAQRPALIGGPLLKSYSGTRRPAAAASVLTAFTCYGGHIQCV